MAKKKKCPECPAGEKWAVPYADFLSLLLALFIALYAISAVNTAKVEALKTELIKVFDFPDSKGVKDSSKNSKNEKQFDGPGIAMQNSESVAKKENTNNERYRVALDQAENQIAIDLPTGVKFDEKSYAVYNPDMINFIHIISMIIKKMPESVAIEVRGYANDYGNYEADYKLGADRAYSVLKMLIDNEIDPKRLRYTSYGNSVVLKNTDSKIAKVYFRVDIRDKKAQNSVLDLISEIK